MKKYIKSPLNYTGNKHRILEEILDKIPKNTHRMLDLFSGGTSVGLNSNINEVIFIDNNIRLINLLIFFKNNDYEFIVKNIEKLIKKYSLTNSFRNGYDFYKKMIIDNPNNGLKSLNKSGYLKLREDYNNLLNKNTKKANIMLYLLILYSFNNDMRFNSEGKFNLPVGKTDFNKANINKLSEYLSFIKNKNFEYMCLDFEDIKIKEIVKKVDFIYMDPPYLITTAVYNESKGWDENKEKKLLQLIDYFIQENKLFVLSNILQRGEKINTILEEWIKKNKNKIEVKYIDYSYKSSSYNKKNREIIEKEIIIYN
jgi:DNA adenine methylase|nr:MAG TPA: adenine-specific methyltransferase [Caudoviricetes sp.]